MKDNTIERRNDMTKTKILYIVEAMGGGVFTYIVDLANELVEEYDIYIAYATRPQTPIDYKEYFDERIHLIKVKKFGRAINPIKDFMSICEIRNIAKNVKPDIIHLHSSKAGVVGRIAFSGNKVPLFYTPHGYSFLMQNYKFLKREIFKLIEAICAKRKCITISCSEGEHKETLKFTNRAICINNGINIGDLQVLLKDVTYNDKHPFTVFTMGRICYQKNPKLFNQIAEAMPNVKFLWVGDGELKEELTASNIEISGWVDRERALEISMNADVFVLTSLWEGLPISILEAMYMKKLCIVNNVIGNRDVIHTGENGYVCDTVNDFINGITNAQNYECDILIQNAFRDVNEQYNTKIMAKKYSDVYQKYISM